MRPFVRTRHFPVWQSGNAMLSMLMATVVGASLVVWRRKQMVAERQADAAVLAARQLAQVT